MPRANVIEELDYRLWPKAQQRFDIALECLIPRGLVGVDIDFGVG